MPVQSEVGQFISVFSLSSVVVLVTSGIAWGKLNGRVSAIEKWLSEADYIPRSEFILLQRSLDNIQEDVREIRKRIT